MTYTPIIGLEVHIELKTKSKMFCSCSADYFAKAPNSHTCPVCLGLPGALPVPNETAITWCQMLGSALNCELLKMSKFDRKNYFYPDLPKGYQISQYDEPFCMNGKVNLSNGKTVRIRRVHMEEDTGKLLHEDLEKSTLIDFNRSGIPLVEIVTEPDFNNAKDVKEYLQKLQQIARYLEISDADMEKGEMRLEPNISLQKNDDNKLPNYKVEVKNINSFKFVEKAIGYEIERQTEILEGGKMPVQETRGWNEAKQKTVTQRIKEEASDYRYFPEPDIPPFRFTDSYIKDIRNKIPELPDTKMKRFIKVFSITNYDSEILIREKSLANYFEETVKAGKRYNISPKQIANYIINKKPDIESILPAKLVEIMSSSLKKEEVSIAELQKAIKEILLKNPEVVNDYKAGKIKVVRFVIGQVMYIIRKRIDAKMLEKLIRKELK